MNNSEFLEMLFKIAKSQQEGESVEFEEIKSINDILVKKRAMMEWDDFVRRFKSEVAEESKISFTFFGKSYDTGIDPNMGIYLKETNGKCIGIYSTTNNMLEAVRDIYFKATYAS